MSNFNELKETQVLLELFETEVVQTADLFNLAGRAADAIAQFIGPIQGSFANGQGQVTVAGFGMLFVEEYETPFGKERFLKYMPRQLRKRQEHIGYISHRFGPGEQYILGPDTVLQGATVEVYIHFAQKLDLIVHKMAEKKSMQVTDIQKALTHLRDYILNGGED